MAYRVWLEEFGQIDHDAPFYVFAVMTGITIIFCIFNIFTGCCIKGLKPGASMDFYIAIGSLLIELCVLIQGLNTGWAEKMYFDNLCQIFPTCLLIGLTMFMGALMVKSWAIFAFYKWNTSKKAPINEEWKPNIWIWLLIIIMGVVTVVWTVVFEKTSTDMGNDIGRPLYSCEWENSFEWLVATFVWHGFLLLAAFFAVFCNCAIGSKARSVSVPVSLVTVNTMAVVIAALCVYYLTKTEQTISYSIFGALEVWMCFFANFVFCIFNASALCCKKGKSSEEGEEHYDTIKSDNSDIVGHSNDQVFSNNQFEPAAETENFNY